MCIIGEWISYNDVYAYIIVNLLRYFDQFGQNFMLRLISMQSDISQHFVFETHLKETTIFYVLRAFLTCYLNGISVIEVFG